MGDHQWRLGAVNLGTFVGVDLNLRPTDDRLYSRYHADTGVKRIKQSKYWVNLHKIYLRQTEAINKVLHITLISSFNQTLHVT